MLRLVFKHLNTSPAMFYFYLTILHVNSCFVSSYFALEVPGNSSVVDDFGIS